MDTVKKLGELAFATRLKRLSERLSKDVSLIYKNLNIDFEAKWFAVISALRENQQMSITGLAENLGISHTAVKQLTEELIKKGYINSLKGSEDERKRLLSLSDEGKNLCTKLKPIWQKIKEANTELINSVDPCLLSLLEKIENELDKFSMYERVWKSLYGTMPGKLTITTYNAKMKKYFKKLNYEWLEEYFTIEDTDKNILLHPKEKIINNGGTIFFALLDEEIVGTCAVIKHLNEKYEIAKMAVTKKYQNLGIGSSLLKAAVGWLKEKNVDKVYLFTNEKLTRANILYKKMGFTVFKNSPFDDTKYHRKTYAMELTLQ